MLHLPRRVRLGVDVGDLLQLQGPLQRHGIGRAAADEEESAGLEPALRDVLERAAPDDELLHLEGQELQLPGKPGLVLRREPPAPLPDPEGQQGQGRKLPHEGLRSGDPDLRSRAQLKESADLPGQR